MGDVTDDAAVWHVERVLSATSGQWTFISCDCLIGEDHTYSEWVARLGRSQYVTD